MGNTGEQNNYGKTGFLEHSSKLHVRSIVEIHVCPYAGRSAASVSRGLSAERNH